MQRMNFKLNMLLAMCLFFGRGNAQTLWKVKEYRIGFTVQNAGISIHGKLEGLQTAIRFDKEYLAASSIEASVDVSTLKTGINLRDKHLKGEDYFDVAHYPKIKMKSVGLTKGAGEGQFVGKFLLTMKNVTKEIVLPFEFHGNEKEGTAQFVANMILNRRDFEVGGKSWTMSDKVEVSLEINVNK